MKLLLVCPRDTFSKRVENLINRKNLQPHVELLGYKKSGELAKIFTKCSAYVFPSFSEGFGIPGLNAMAAKVPLICSDISVFKEVYADGAIYFDPNDPEDIAKKISSVLKNNKLRKKLTEIGTEQVKRYSWRKMAVQTLKIYESA